MMTMVLSLAGGSTLLAALAFAAALLRGATLGDAVNDRSWHDYDPGADAAFRQHAVQSVPVGTREG